MAVTLGLLGSPTIDAKDSEERCTVTVEVLSCSGKAIAEVEVEANFEVESESRLLKGVTDNESGVDAKVSLNYIEIPVVLSVSLTGPDSQVGFNLFGGPAFAFKAGCQLEGSGEGVTVSVDCDEAGGEVKTLDISGVIGAGVPAGESLSIWVNGGLDLSLTSWDGSDDSEDVKNRALFLSVGVSFPVGG